MQRVLYVAAGRAYGDHARGVAYEERYFHEPLRRFPGLEVEHFDFVAQALRDGQRAMSERLVRRVTQLRPDLVFLFPFAADRDPLPERVLEISAGLGVPTVAWMADDQWRFSSYGRHWAPYLDWIVTTDPDAVARYAALGARARCILSQWGVNHRLYRPTLDPQDLDVAFVGQAHGDRIRVVEQLRARGIAVAVFGHGWGEGVPRLPFHEMVRVFSRARINLNLTNSWSDPSRQIKGRNFEVPGCWGFLLTEQAPHLERYFALEQEVATFADADQLVERVHWYLAHEAERRRIAVRGYRRCLAEHTCDHRLAAILAAVGCGAALEVG